MSKKQLQISRFPQSWTVPFFAWGVSRLIVLVSWVMAGLVDPQVGIRDAVLKWDGAWYYSIALNWYEREVPAGQSNIAFFPGFPSVVRVIEFFSGLSTYQSLVFVATTTGLLAVVAVWNLTRVIGFDDDDQAFLTYLFAVSPGSAVLSMAYSEGMYIALTAIALSLMIQGRWRSSSIALAFLGLVRPSAFVVIIVCQAFFLTQILKSDDLQTKRRLGLAILLAPIGIVVYAAFLEVWTGSFLNYFEVQREGWGESFSFLIRMSDIKHASLWVLDGFGLADWNRVVPGLIVLLSLILLITLGRAALPPIFFWYSLATCVLFLSSTTLGMRPRFFLAAFPLLFGLPAILRSLNQRLIVLIGSAATMSLLSTVFVSTLSLTP